MQDAYNKHIAVMVVAKCSIFCYSPGLTWTLSAAQNRREKRGVTVAPRQNELGARTKHTGMCLAVVHVISKTLRDHLAGFSCFNVVHSPCARHLKPAKWSLTIT